jgi:hypothetical protein
MSFTVPYVVGQARSHGGGRRTLPCSPSMAGSRACPRALLEALWELMDELRDQRCAPGTDALRGPP